MTAPTLERSLRRGDALAALALVATVLVAGWIRMAPGVCGAFHDDAVYALTAKALATGEGYRLIQLPSEPAQTKYPILYPALLAMLWGSGDSVAERVTAMQLATLAIAALAVAGAYLHLVRFGHASRGAAFGGALVAASAPNLLYYATATLSEMPFALALIAALWVVDAASRTERCSLAWGLAVGVVVAAPFMVRTAGIVVVPAALVALALRGRQVRAVAAGALLASAPWIAWALLASDASTDAVTSYQTDYVAWWRATIDTTGVRYVAVNFGKALAATTHIALEATAREVYARSDSAWLVARAVGLLPWLWLAARALRREPWAVVLSAYLAFVCFWPWAPDRFIVPALPFLAAAWFAALERAGGSVSSISWGRGAQALAVLAALALSAANARLLARYADVERSSGYSYFRLPDEPVAWSSYLDAFDWLRASRGKDDVVLAGFDTMTALYTDRHAVRPYVPRPEALFYGSDAPLAGTIEELEAIVATHHPRYVFLSPMPAFPEEGPLYQLIGELVRRHPDRMKPVYVGTDPRFVIYSIR